MSTMKGTTDVRKRGYLKKIKNSRKRYYVLRLDSEAGPGRLECYDNEKKFNQNGQPRSVIQLSDCHKVTEMSNDKHQYCLGFYTNDDCYGLYAESAEELESWRVAAEDVKNPKHHKSRSNENIWQVTLSDRGIAKSKQLAGAYNLELLPMEMKLCRLGSANTKQPLILKYSSIRRCGHSDSYFFIETGRSSCIGPGELWMDVDDKAIAELIHEKALAVMRTSKTEKPDSSRVEDSDGKSSSAKENRSRSSTMPSRPRRPQATDDTKLNVLPSITTTNEIPENFPSDGTNKKSPKRFSFSHLFAHTRSKSASSANLPDDQGRSRTYSSITKFDRPPKSHTAHGQNMSRSSSEASEISPATDSVVTASPRLHSMDKKGTNLDPVTERVSKGSKIKAKTEAPNYVNTAPISMQTTKSAATSDYVNVDLKKSGSSTNADYMNMQSSGSHSTQSKAKSGSDVSSSKSPDYVNIDLGKSSKSSSSNKSSDYVNVKPGKQKLKASKSSDYVNMEPGKMHASADYVNMEPGKMHASADYVNMEPTKNKASNYKKGDASKRLTTSTSDYVNMEPRKVVSQSSSDYVNMEPVKKSSSVGDYMNMMPGQGNKYSSVDKGKSLKDCKQAKLQSTSSSGSNSGDYMNMQPGIAQSKDGNYVEMQPGQASGGDYVTMQAGKDTNNIRPSDYIDIDISKESMGDYMNMDSTSKRSDSGGKKEFVDYIETSTDSDARSRSSSDNNNGSTNTRSTNSNNTSAVGPSSVRVSRSDEHFGSSKSESKTKGTTKKGGSVHVTKSNESSSYVNMEAESPNITIQRSSDVKGVQYVDVEHNKMPRPSKSEKISGGRLSSARSPSKVAPPFMQRNVPMSSSVARSRKPAKVEEKAYTEIDFTKSKGLAETKEKGR